MFDAIAPSYDLLNRLISLRQDLSWRRELVRRVSIEEPQDILDLAAGTCDLSIALAKALPECTVVAGDLSREMIRLGEAKAQQSGVEDQVLPVLCDAMAMPFRDECFDVVTCGFGVRNFDDSLGGLREMFRVLRPGGLVAVLELCEPRSPLLFSFYRLYAYKVIPLLGKLLGGNKGAYAYLPRSIAEVSQREEMAQLLRLAGFERVAYHLFIPDVCALYVGYRPSLK